MFADNYFTSCDYISDEYINKIHMFTSETHEYI